MAPRLTEDELFGAYAGVRFAPGAPSLVVVRDETEVEPEPIDEVVDELDEESQP